MNTPVHIAAVPSLSTVERDEWDCCADQTGPPAHDAISPRSRYPTNPFVSYDFLNSLEHAGCVGPNVGWIPHHLVARQDSRIVGAAPCYIKTHSRGEYVFDQGWAEAFARAGGAYYPKLQVAVPFTPATGPRLLVPPSNPDQQTLQLALARALVSECDRLGASSAHLTFLPQEEARLLGDNGFLTRIDHQFHFHNDSYASFDDFLATLSSRYRKVIRRERREALSSGISVEWLTGDAITEAALDAFFAFYIETGARKWGRPYLNRLFYSLIAERMRDRIVLIMAKRENRFIAGAINFLGGETLYGRHWGAVEHHPFLHFEICYYQAIDYAIAHRLAWVEAGAQGEHKLARGYLPKTTYSAHYIAHSGLRDAVADYLVREHRYIAMLSNELTAAAPFRTPPTHQEG